MKGKEERWNIKKKISDKERLQNISTMVSLD